MKIVELRERTLRIGAPMRNAEIGFDTMTASALVMIADTGQRGYAFDSIGRYGKGALLRERFFPRLAGKVLVDDKGRIDPPACARAAMANEKSGGHGERPGAVALLEAAAWDLRAKAEGVPLWRSIADYYGTRDAGPTIPVYASGGHFGADVASEVKNALGLGYAIFKIKALGTDEDWPRVDAAVGADARVAVDLNGALRPERAERWFDRAGQFHLEWIEEPAPPLDYELLGRYVQLSRTPIATGENLFSFDDARNLLRYGGLRPDRDLIQVDPLLAYGVGEYVRILSLDQRWDRRRFVPHAGHLFAAHCVAGLGLGMAEAAPDDALLYGGYWDGVRIDRGRVTIPEAPGVGFERKRNLLAVLESL